MVSIEFPDGNIFQYQDVSRRFDSSEAVMEFVEDEIAVWGPLCDQMAGAGVVERETVLSQVNHLNSISSYVLHLNKSVVGSARYLDSLHNVYDLLSQYFSGRYVVSDSIVGKRIRDLAGIDSTAATLVYADAIELAVPLVAVRDVLAVVKASQIAFEDLRLDREPNEILSRQFRDASRRWERKVSGSAEKFVKEFEKLKVAYEVDINRSVKRRQRLTNVSNSLLRKFDSMMELHNHRLSKMEEAFSSEMKLRASEKFWREKQKLHVRKSERALMQIFFLFPIVGVVLVCMYLSLSLLLFSGIQFNAGQAFAYGTPTVLAVWVLRLMVRNYRSNVDFADDAAERATMVYTFKALEYEDRASDAERAIILQALFRPHEARGEDAQVPNPVWESVLKQLDKVK